MGYLYYSSIYLLLLYGLAFSLEDTTIVLQKVTTVSGTKYNATCVVKGEAMKSAISWITDIQSRKSNNIVSAFLPKRNFLNTDNINWKQERSLNGFLGPVLDRRWEKFETIHTDESRTYTNVALIENSNQFQIHISVRTEEAHIYLCDNEYPPYGNCYWILLNAWERSRTGIRKCERYAIPSRGYPKPPCKDVLSDNNHTDQPMLNPARWSHFTIQRNNNNILLYKLDKLDPVLNYIDAATNFKTTHVVVVSPSHRIHKTKGGFWKVHDYTYFMTTEKFSRKVIVQQMSTSNQTFCVSFFVAMCPTCSLLLQVLDSSTSRNHSIAGLNNQMWQEVKIIEKNIFETVRLSATGICDGCYNQFWAINHFELCSENEILVSTTELDNLNEASCEIVNSSVQVKYSDGLDTEYAPGCDNGKFGKGCFSCRDVFGNFNCDQSIICDITPPYNQSTCRCSKGYKGNACENPCSHNTYGFKCLEKCGYCEYPVHSSQACNSVSGTCTLGCLYNFQGEYCKQPPFPILQHPPEILKIGHTSVEVELRNFLYDGEPEPTFYQIQYKESSLTEWNGYENIEFRTEKLVQINNLTVLTTYVIRAVLITADNSSFVDNIVPTTNNFTTTCEYIQKDRIGIETSNTSASFVFINTEDSCPHSSYYLRIENYTPIMIDRVGFKIDGLQPFTNYTAVLLSTIKKDFIINLNFLTTEGASEMVHNLLQTQVDESTIEISWFPPSKPNGIVRHYEVFYEHIKYTGCSSDSGNSNDKKRTFIEYSNTIRISNLTPDSQYTITVVPFTVMMGAPVTLLVETLPSETPSESEIPLIREIRSESIQIHISFSPPHCTSTRGLLDYYVTFRCRSWCTTQSPTTLNYSFINFKEPLKLTNLAPYTNYTVNIAIARKNGRSRVSGMEFDFTTKTAVPNLIRDIEVFSKNGTSISFRFPPPYPPTGLLDEIYLYYYTGWYASKELYIPLQTCKLWPALLCVTVTNLTPNRDYNLQVRAKNNGTNFNDPTIISAKTVQAVSDPPQNLSAVWDDYYNLTLSWIHPSITNGPLTRFDIEVFTGGGSFKRYVPIKEEDYLLIYTYVIEIKNDSFYSSHLNIGVRSYNIMASHTAVILTSSPPATPNIKPTVLEVGNCTISLDIQGLSNLQDTAQMFIFVSTDDIRPNEQVFKHELLWRKANIRKDLSTWIVADLNVTSLKMSKNTFLIGNGNKSISAHLHIEINNKILQPSTNYIVTILTINDFEGLKRHSALTINVTTGGHKIDNGSSSSGLLALLLLFLIPVIVYIALRYHKNKQSLSWNTIVTIVNTGGRGATNPDVIPLTNENLHPANSEKKSEITNKADSSKIDPYSKPIKIVEFEKYVKESIENGELERQHQLFPRGQTKPWDYGKLPENKSKNRYNNLIAYDHTRVKLEKLDGDEFSDYINANYIEGYKTSKGYIATQGPKPGTVVDFWRMIWQENVRYIVMLANVIEGGKKKTEQYWPNVGESLEYGYIRVYYLHSEVYADYEYRTFAMQCKKEERTVEQLHFVSWPDHGVPLYSQSVVPFLRKLLTIPQGKAPVVVHCSAGVGRTGTIILCDLCLRMAAREGVVDVLKHQHKIRQQRVNLVDNAQQYILVHLVLLECLIAPQTNLPCDDSIEKGIEKIIQSSTLQRYMEYLRNTEWQDHAMETQISITYQTQWENKNRFQDIVPNTHGRVYISRYPIGDEHSDYINAVEVDGFRAPQRFIATQQPLPHTVSDFWRMVDEKEATTIVSLNRIMKDDLDTCIFWPTQNVEEISPVPYLKLRFHNKTKYENYAVTTLHLYNNKHKKSIKRTINLISFKRWPSTKIAPDSKDDLLQLWVETETLSRGNSNPIIVTCHNGATACGLFLALAFLIEKINLEQQCDVCLAVRTIRRNRTQFVSEKEQFIFLYQSALVYLSRFSLYSNFTTPTTSNSGNQ